MVETPSSIWRDNISARCEVLGLMLLVLLIVFIKTWIFILTDLQNGAKFVSVMTWVGNRQPRRQAMKLVKVVKSYSPDILNELLSSAIFKIVVSLSFGFILEDNLAGIVAQFILSKITEKHINSFLSFVSHHLNKWVAFVWFILNNEGNHCYNSQNFSARFPFYLW